jgi:hypothetical protein
MAPIGCARIYLREPRAQEYMAITTMKSNKGWHSQWFYIKNDDAARLPLFTSHTITAAPPAWSWGPMDKEKAHPIPKHHHAPEGPWPLRRWHYRGLPLEVGGPLMARTLPLFGMVPGVQLEGTALAQAWLRNLEIQHRIREALEEPDATFLVEGHPPMRPDTGFIDLISISQPLIVFYSFSRLLPLISRVGTCRVGSALSAIPARCCRRMKPRKRQTVRPTRHARRRRMHKRPRRTRGSTSSCSVGSTGKDRMRRRWRMTTMLMRRRTSETTYPGMSWRVMTMQRHPFSHRCQLRGPPAPRLPRRSRGRLCAWRRWRRIVTPC